MMRWALVPLVLVAPATTMAQASPAAQAFAQAYVPAGYVDDAEAAFRKEAARSLDAQGSQFAAMEARYPGLRKTVIDAGARVTRQEYQADLPALHASVANLVGGAFTPAELAELTGFLRSDAGQAMQQAARRNMDSSRAIDAARAAGKPTALTPDQLMSSVDVVGAIGSLTPTQVAALAAFSSSATGQKFQQFTPRLLARITEHTNGLIQKAMPKVQQAMMLAMRDAGRRQKER